MSDAQLIYCRPKECSYCIAFVANIETRDARIAELEARVGGHHHWRLIADKELKERDKHIAELETDLALSQDQRIGEIDRFNGQAARAEQAEAELAERDGMLTPLWQHDGHFIADLDYGEWFADLRTRAKEGIGDE